MWLEAIIGFTLLTEELDSKRFIFMHIIISILSDQLIPNVLFIKQMAGPQDYHIFLTTERMERDQKSAILADTLELGQDRYVIISIDPNRPDIILELLKRAKWPKAEKFIVNITGGTKMMSQAVFMFFSKKENTEIYYWPIGTNVMEQLHPEIKEITIENPVQLDLKTYFRAHGYDYTFSPTPHNPKEKTENLFKKVIAAGSAEKVPEIVQAKREEYLRPDKQYYLGGWFEEWLYDFLKSKLHLKAHQIGLNLKLKSRKSVRKTESDNEIDIAFVYNNRLFIWECKVYYTRSGTGKKIAEAVYKISSLRNTLGLQATSLVALMVPFGTNAARKNYLKDLSQIMQVKKVFSLEDMRDKESFLKNIKACPI